MNDRIAFWSDFQDLGSPGGFKKTEKTASKNERFFEVEKKQPKRVFLILGSFLGSFLASFWRTLEALWQHFFWLLSGVALGSLSAPFWSHFGIIFGVIPEVFFVKNVVLPAWELIFRKFLCISCFLCCRRASQK